MFKTNKHGIDYNLKAANYITKLNANAERFCVSQLFTCCIEMHARLLFP